MTTMKTLLGSNTAGFPFVSSEGIARLSHMIEQAKAVSFDFFDTLFIRTLKNPEDVFDLIGRQFGIDRFRDIRRAAQVEAFSRMHAAGKKEITLRGIYDCLRIPGHSSDDLMRSEYELELELVRPNPELVEVYEAAVASGKPVVITSDMYLPQEFFAEAMEKHGLSAAELFVSANQNATKRDHGELFDLVVTKLGLEHRQVLHVGDNLNSDVKQAKQKGLMTFHYQSPCALPELKSGNPTSSLAQGLLRCHYHSLERDSYEELGYLYGGPAAVGFLDWIEEQAKQDRIDHLLFVSRDGYVLHRIANATSSFDLPKHDYFLGSRTAFTLAAITEQTFASYIPFLLSGSEGLLPKEVLERIGVTPPAETVLNDLGLSDEVRISASNMEHLGRFLYAYRWEILKVSSRNRRALFQYLKKIGISRGSRVGLVDVGWNGTTQEAFEVATKPLFDLQVFGYYFCLSTTAECLRRQGHQRMAALVSPATTSSDVVNKVYANRVSAEVFFSAPHHSVIGLQASETGDVIPIEDAGRGDTSHLLEILGALTKGMEEFSGHFVSLRNKLGHRSQPMELAWPLVEAVADHNSSLSLRLNALKNFDSWGSSRNRVLSPLDYGN